MNSIKVTPQKSNELLEAAMQRMRWKLWFSFAESKYVEFRKENNTKKPNYHIINNYCKEHWGKEIGEMSKSELQEKIAIVKKWKCKK
ncbi:MAG: hypothetical protein PHH37_08445 [Paludibacter sp.]|nr:hypothetical protein [Paludibacter sp.]